MAAGLKLPLSIMLTSHFLKSISSVNGTNNPVERMEMSNEEILTVLGCGYAASLS